MGLFGEKNEIQFEVIKHKNLKTIEAMNETYEKKDLGRVGYRESWNGFAMEMVVVVLKGEEEKAKKILKKSAEEYFQKLNQNIEEIISMLSEK